MSLSRVREAIADRVDLTIDFKATRIGPPLAFKQ
jgi:hypothetical protein